MMVSLPECITDECRELQICTVFRNGAVYEVGTTVMLL